MMIYLGVVAMVMGVAMFGVTAYTAVRSLTQRDYFEAGISASMALFSTLLIFVAIACWTGHDKTFVCSHEPHMGACAVMATTYYYNAATKTMMPIQTPCGCTSDHGATVLQPKR